MKKHALTLRILFICMMYNYIPVSHAAPVETLFVPLSHSGGMSTNAFTPICPVTISGGSGAISAISITAYNNTNCTGGNNTCAGWTGNALSVVPPKTLSLDKVSLNAGCEPNFGFTSCSVNARQSMRITFTVNGLPKQTSCTQITCVAGAVSICQSSMTVAF